MSGIAVRFFLVVMFLGFLGPAYANETEDPEFGEKLQEMLERTDKSIKIIRDQISENQSAPFIADLYLQLGELLSQRANTLYYIQMERHKMASQTTTATKEFNPVVETQKEAIVFFRKILAEFPKYLGRKKVLFLLAVTYKSIDEQVGFEDTTTKLIKEYGSTQEGMQARLLLGQHHFDKGDFGKAWTLFEPVSRSKFAYERNLAKYRMGLVNLTREKHKDALDLFRAVVVDDELKEEDNPFAVSLETKSVKSSLKREALIDSIRAYTYVFKVNPDPVSYYAAICPTEVLFQEVIEKLAYRYISIKKYEHAVGLLRTLSERLADPQKIMNIYHEVLLAIPPDERIEIPVQEIRFVLQKYNVWTNYYELPSKVKAEAAIFFEKQVRDLGTKSHDRAKRLKGRTALPFLLKARDFYLLYLGFYPTGPNSVKMGINLGDVYYRLGDYQKSGEYYLRTFSGEFGSPQTKAKKALIENAILILQKNQKQSYFDQLRVRGLLHRGIESYMAFDKRQQSNPELLFTYIKNQFDQGFYEAALNGFYDYIKRFPQHKNAVNSGEIILDYFNTKNDVEGMNRWSQKILATANISPVLRKRVEAIKSQVQLKQLQETVKAASGGDEFAQGKGYLEAALTVSDEGLKSVALKQALSRSRAEQDVETFFKAAKLIADKEADMNQRFKILVSIPQESMGMGRFYLAIQQYLEIASRKDLQAAQKSDLVNRAVHVGLILKDFNLLEGLLRRAGNNLTSENQKRLQQQMVDVLESAAAAPEWMVRRALASRNDQLMVAAFKAQYKVPKWRAKILAASKSHCRSQASSVLCGWLKLTGLDRARSSFVKSLSGAGASLEGVDPAAQSFVKVMNQHQELSAYRDPVLQIALTLRNKQLFEHFAAYLNRVAKANKEVAMIINKKVQESIRNAQQAHKRCKTIMDSAGIYSPINRFCVLGKVPSLSDAIKWPKLARAVNLGKDPHDKEIDQRQKGLFVNPGKGENFRDLLAEYRRRGYLGMVSAGAVYGSSAFGEFKSEFNAMLGCSLIPMGLYSEAAYFLTSASSEVEAQQCRQKLEGLVE